MSFIFKLPDVGEGMAEGEIVQWYVKEGDKIAEETPLLELQNDKLSQDVLSPVGGTVKKIIVGAGTTAKVGEPIVEIEAEGAVPAAGKPAPEAQKPAPAPTAGASDYVFKLPDVGEGMAEGEIVQWYVKEGDKIAEETPLLELQNDKLSQDVLSPVGGTIKKIIVGAGTTAKVGEPIVSIVTEGAHPADAAPVSAKAPEALRPAEKDVHGDNITVLALPSVRRYAYEHDVDLSQVVPSGRHGQIRKEDVDAYLAGGSVKPAATPTPVAQEPTAPVATPAAPAPAPVAKPLNVGNVPVEREKMSNTRKAIAKAMVTSKHTAPHVTFMDEFVADNLVAHRKKYKEIAAQNDVKLTYLPYVVKALVLTAKKFPIINASLDDAAQEIVYKKAYNIGIATDTDRGLYVPNIKNADTKGIFAIAKEISTHAEAAHAGSLKAEDMRDGTVSISNLGSGRGQWFTPVINYPESCILGIGRIEPKPVVLDGEIKVAQVMYLSLSFDHRLIDGMTAQRVLNEIKRLLQDPELLLMEG